MQRHLLGPGRASMPCTISMLRSSCGKQLQRLRVKAAGMEAQVHLLACGGLTGVSSVAAFASSGMNDVPLTRQQRSSPYEFWSPVRRCTDIIMLLNAALFAAQWLSKDALTMWGAKVNSLILAGQWWRLLTSSFLHTSLFHLAINAHALHTIGPHMEMLSGRKRFLTIYLVSAVSGTAASFMLNPSPSVGASAALFGLGAALGMFYYRHRHILGNHSHKMLQSLGMTLAVNLAYSAANRRIDNWGHFGGMVGGALMSWLLGPRLVKANGKTVDQPPLSLMAGT
eukprot:jgi/Chrzof1/1288/Cz10g01100.t1